MKNHRNNNSFRFVAAGIDSGIRMRLREATIIDSRFRLKEIDHFTIPLEYDGPVILFSSFEVLSNPMLNEIVERGFPLIVSGPASLLLRAFELGVADYLREPWSVEELLARCGRIASRFPIPVSNGLLTITSEGITGPGGSVDLSAAEGKLLRLLCSVPGRLVGRMELALRVGLENGSRALDVHICHLRKKLVQAVPAWANAHQGPIICERAKGYRFIPS
ncbi:response regulator transcription factor [Sediminispirochaeta bajacaliforniensis]|uniref:response regulator transcription factor n=1 Tax=Sediminispirochaeta bajacaliforniensis TaxID=148 RepID=UPI00036F0D99|nr:winged helix-turn-helix domain-containing protein [Sediminispirochaeta bajacaliforniensis]